MGGKGEGEGGSQGGGGDGRCEEGGREEIGKQKRDVKTNRLTSFWHPYTRVPAQLHVQNEGANPLPPAI